MGSMFLLASLQFQMDVLSVFRDVSPTCASFTDAYFSFFQNEMDKTSIFFIDIFDVVFL